MPEQLIATAGVWYFAAGIAVFVAMFVEQAGAARSPEEDSERKRGSMLALMLATLMTVGLLLLHGVFHTTGAGEALRFEILAAPIVAMMLGSLVGAIFGAIARGAAPLMRKLALPLVLIALALTLYAALPTIVALVNGLRELSLQPV